MDQTDPVTNVPAPSATPPPSLEELAQTAVDATVALLAAKWDAPKATLRSNAISMLDAALIVGPNDCVILCRGIEADALALAEAVISTSPHPADGPNRRPNGGDITAGAKVIAYLLDHK